MSDIPDLINRDYDEISMDLWTRDMNWSRYMWIVDRDWHNKKVIKELWFFRSIFYDLTK